MTLSLIACIGIVLFLVLMILRMPLGLAMALSGFIGLCLTRGQAAAMSNIALIAYRQATFYTWTVIPLFVFLGVLAYRGGISERAFSTIYKWVGHKPGGLAMATSCTCAAFGSVCGDHIATAATMCSVSLPEMRKYNYSDTLSLGCIASSGNIGFLIPPSTGLIIYGIITEVSIGSLFLAGILPGLLLTLLFCLTIYLWCRRNPELGPKGPKFTWKERFRALCDVWDLVLIFILVIGGIYMGFFTPTVAGAVGAFAVFIVGICTRRLTSKGFIEALIDTGRTSAMIFLVIIGALIFSSFLASTELPLAAAAFIETLKVPPIVVLTIILFFYIVVGFFMEIISVLMITLPIFFPIVTKLGFDPILFGILSLLTVLIGAITPPVGILAFTVKGMAPEVPLLLIFRGCLPFLLAMIICLVILTVFPQISLFLPNLMSPY